METQGGDKSSASSDSYRGALDIHSRAPLVFWDGYGLENPFSGVGRYGRSLADKLKKIGCCPVIIGDTMVLKYFPDCPRLELLRLSHHSKIGRLKFIWPFRVGLELSRNLRGDMRQAVIHGLSNFNLPYFFGLKSIARVLTVHDIIPILAPKGVSVSYRLQYRTLLSKALREADKIICVSDWTKTTLLQEFPKYEQKCLVIQNGVVNEDNSGFSDRIKSRFPECENASPWFLCVTRGEVYKNLPLIPKIMSALPRNWKGAVVTDKRGSMTLKSLAPSLIDSGRLRIFVNIEEQHLSSLYLNSSLYLHVSLYEGFCLPVAEAINRGLPIVYLTGSAIEEIVDDIVAVGMSRSASPGEWAEACVFAAQKTKEPDWFSHWQRHLSMLPTWDGAARKLRILYNSFY